MRSSYQFENLESRDLEAGCLAERARMRLGDFVPLLKRHGFPNRGRALEVGCGHGLRTLVMAENFPDVEVTGIDRSRELLDSARESARGMKNLRLGAHDLYELPFENDSFDFIYARLVFMHLENPSGALRELKRILRPGGRILIEDADRDCMFFEPQPKSFPDFWKKVQDGQRRLGGDPNVGRKLAPLFKEEGFEDIRLEAQPLTGGGDEIEFLVRTLLPSLNLYLAPEDRPSGTAAIGDLARLASDSRATYYHFWFAVSAMKK